MMNDIMLFLDRKELEFIKSEVVAAVDKANDNMMDKEFVITLAAKLIKACNENDNVEASISKDVTTRLL